MSQDNTGLNVLSEHGLTDDIESKAMEAAQKVIEDAGLDSSLFIASIEISEIPPEVVEEVKVLGCGYRRVCSGSRRVCDWYTDAQGNRWRRCYSVPNCRMVPNPCPK